MKTQAKSQEQYSPEQIYSLLRDKTGVKSGRALAKFLCISHQYMSDMLRGQREPGKCVLEFLGLVRVKTVKVVYVKSQSENGGGTVK